MPHQEQCAEVGMLAVEVLGGVVVLLALAYVLSRDSATIDDEPVDSIDGGLPSDRLLRSDDIQRLRFRVGLRGYRMSDVDAALAAAQLSLAAAEGHPVADDAELAEQPPTSTERPLSELEETYAVPDDEAR
jgi:DivIVA domain-containing protein